MVNDLLDSITGKDQVDLMQCLAHLILSTLGRIIDLGSLTCNDLDKLNQNALVLIDYFKGLCDEREKTP